MARCDIAAIQPACGPLLSSGADDFIYTASGDNAKVRGVNGALCVQGSGAQCGQNKVSREASRSLC